MSSHKFKVGDMVELRPAASRNVRRDIYKITRRLPGDGECEYRIKSAAELHERVAWESELTRR